MTGKYLLLALLATAAFAQDPVSITPYQLLDARSGQAVACSGCSIYTYAAGTNTPLATYTSSTLATPNTNPVLTNSAGYAVNGATITGIWVGTSCYKLVAKDSTAVTLFTQDNICDRGAVLKALLAGSGGAALVGYTYPNSGFNRTVQVRLQESSAISVKDFGVTGDGTTDDTAKIQLAVNSACSASGRPSAVFFPTGTYRIVGTISWAGDNCFLQGAGAGSTWFVHDPSSANTDMISFPGTISYNEWNGVSGIRFHTLSATNSRYLLSAANQRNFMVSRSFFRVYAAGRPTNYIRLTGMLGSWVQNNLIQGPSIGTNPLIYVGTSGLGVSTTVNILNNTLVNSGSGGPCMELIGGSGSASILVQGNIIETCTVGVLTGTGTDVINNHIEANTVSAIKTTQVVELQVVGNNVQHAGSGAYYDIAAGSVVNYGYNPTPDFTTGKVLFHTANPAANTRINLNAATPMFPFYQTDSTGVINDGDISSLSNGVLSNQTHVATGVSGTFTTRLFQGNKYNLSISGPTTIKFIGGSGGAATPLGLPPGETWTFNMVNTSGSVVSSGDGSLGNFPVLGSINNNNLVAGYQQTVIAQTDDLGNVKIISSPGWSPVASGSGYIPAQTDTGVLSPAPGITFSGAAVGMTYGFQYGEYSRVGKNVTVMVTITLTAKGSSVGSLRITGMPFTNAYASTTSCYVGAYTDMAAVTSGLSCTMVTGTTELQILRSGGASSVLLADTDITNTTSLQVTVTYKTP